MELRFFKKFRSSSKVNFSGCQVLSRISGCQVLSRIYNAMPWHKYATRRFCIQLKYNSKIWVLIVRQCTHCCQFAFYFGKIANSRLSLPFNFIKSLDLYLQSYLIIKVHLHTYITYFLNLHIFVT
jgi:hypothetical protein